MREERAVTRAMFNLLWCLLGFSASVSANTPPPFERLRQDENWTEWCRSSLNDDLSYKCMRPGLNSLLSLGGEARWRYAMTRGSEWENRSDGYDDAYFQRYVVFADWRLPSGIRMFTQLNSALSSGLKQGPSPLDENLLSFQQAFLQLPVSDNWQLRLGTQELHLGSGRLLDVREGPNVRRRYNALRLTTNIRAWQIDTLYGRPWQTSLGSFDDRVDYKQAIWGVYGVNRADSGRNLDMYYLGYRNREANYFQGTGDERRHTLGARIWGTRERLTLNWEFMLQWGRFDNQDIEAWSIATDTQYALERDPTTRVGLSANVASGDKSPNDDKFGTFNAMFPRGNYFSELATLGPRNFYNIQPYFTLQPLPAIEVTTAVNFYWRLSTKDGVYGPGGNILNVDSGSDLRYVATEFSFNTTFNYTDATKLSLVYGRSFPAALVQQTGNRGATDYFEITAKVLF